MSGIATIIGRGTFSARPAAGTAGSVYFDTTNSKTWRDNGTTWDDVSDTGSGLTNPMSSPNDLIIGGSSGTPTRLATSASKVLSTDGSGVISWQTAATGSSTLAADTDVSISSPASGQALLYTGSAWANKNPPGTELAYVAATSAFPTTSSSFVDVTSMSVTLTMPGTACWVEFWSGYLFSVSTTEQDVQIFDVTGSAQVALGAVGTNMTNGGAPILLRAKVTPSAGSRTYKVQLRSTAGASSTLFASATSPMYLRVITG